MFSRLRLTQASENWGYSNETDEPTYGASRDHESLAGRRIAHSAIVCDASHLRLKADSHSRFQLIGILIG
jgi:hypothetical protein